MKKKREYHWFSRVKGKLGMDVHFSKTHKNYAVNLNDYDFLVNQDGHLIFIDENGKEKIADLEKMPLYEVISDPLHGFNRMARWTVSSVAVGVLATNSAKQLILI
jgi:hypothetical protein